MMMGHAMDGGFGEDAVEVVRDQDAGSGSAEEGGPAEKRSVVLAGARFGASDEEDAAGVGLRRPGTLGGAVGEGGFTAFRGDGLAGLGDAVKLLLKAGLMAGGRKGFDAAADVVPRAAGQQTKDGEGMKGGAAGGEPGLGSKARGERLRGEPAAVKALEENERLDGAALGSELAGHLVGDTAAEAESGEKDGAVGLNAL